MHSMSAAVQADRHLQQKSKTSEFFDLKDQACETSTATKGGERQIKNSTNVKKEQSVAVESPDKHDGFRATLLLNLPMRFSSSRRGAAASCPKTSADDSRHELHVG